MNLDNWAIRNLKSICETNNPHQIWCLATPESFAAAILLIKYGLILSDPTPIAFGASLMFAFIPTNKGMRLYNLLEDLERFIDV